MHGKSPQKTNLKKQGKSLKEKRAAKKAKHTDKSFTADLPLTARALRTP